MYDDGQGLDGFFSPERGKHLYDALPDNVRITFALTGPGGGTWTVHRDFDGHVEVIRAAVRRPDCRLTCSVDDFTALVEGRLNVRQAFMEERIEVAGDVGLVLRLQKLLARRRAPA